jgi:hypothetical protein
MLTVHTFAGQMHTTVIDPPPPPSVTTDGQMDTPVTGQIGLGLLQSVMSLL